jgi:serine/threonine-protein kinase
MSLQIPKRYVFTGKEFSGGMSRSRQYRDDHLQRLVVIKEVTDPDAAPRIFDEIAALQRIRSKHVVEVYDVIVGGDSTQIAIVEDFVDGPDVEEIAEDEEFGQGELLPLLFQVADAIAEVHTQNVIHRDVTARNIKRDSSGYLKLFDFGLARVENVNNSTTGYVGTPGYSAPELYSKGKVFFSKATDIFGFGAVAWTLAAGELPDWAKKLSLGEAVGVPSISTVADLPPKVAQLVDRAMSIDPALRPNATDAVETIARELLFDKHRATLFSGTISHTINSGSRAARVGSPRDEKVVVRYDGYTFRVTECKGDVYVNYDRCAVGRVIDGSCVIALGSPDLGMQRVYVTIDVSCPEVTIGGTDAA